jgi:hypothetical protein
MMKLALLSLVLLGGCAARTGYNADHTKSWLCIPQTRPVQVPGEPVAVTEAKPAESAAATQK